MHRNETQQRVSDGAFLYSGHMLDPCRRKHTHLTASSASNSNIWSTVIVSL